MFNRFIDWRPYKSHFICAMRISPFLRVLPLCGSHSFQSIFNFHMMILLLCSVGFNGCVADLVLGTVTETERANSTTRSNWTFIQRCLPQQSKVGKSNEWNYVDRGPWTIFELVPVDFPMIPLTSCKWFTWQRPISVYVASHSMKMLHQARIRLSYVINMSKRSK